MEQRSNRHLFKLRPGLPCWSILTFSSKLETVLSVHNDEHKFPPAKTLFALDQSEFFMDRLSYHILLLYFITLCSLYRTAYNPVTYKVILQYKQIFILPSGLKMLIYNSIIYSFKCFKHLLNQA